MKTPRLSNTRLLRAVLATALGWLSLGGHAFAFIHGDDFGAYPSTKLGAGGGRYFTGSPAEGFDCSVCHTSDVDWHPPLYQKGLPVNGYVPGQIYREITLTWPEVTQKEAEAAAAGLHPKTALMAEIVSEDGGNAGTIQFLNAQIRKDGYCVQTSPAEKPDFAATIYSVAKGKLAFPITAALTDSDKEDDQKKAVCQTGGDDEQRCVLFVGSCGAKSIRFNWTAPPKLRGPVWFTAGLVHTFDGTDKPNDRDFTTLLSIPMNAAQDGATYESTLESGCSVVAAGHHRGASQSQRGAAVLIMLSVLGLLQRTRKRRAFVQLLAAVSLASANAACSEAPVTVMRDSAAVGRFEPALCPDCEKDAPVKCRLGTEEQLKACLNKANGGSAAPTIPGAGNTSLSASMLAPMSAGAAAPAAPAATINGKLQISFTTAQPIGSVSAELQQCIDNPNNKLTGCRAPNYTAVWIEDMAGHFVKMLEQPNGSYIFALTRWLGMGQDCVCEMDVITTPSQVDHIAHMVTWSGRDAQGNPAPLGNYQVQIEVAIGNMGQTWHATIPFTIDAAPAGKWPVMVTPMVPHSGVTLNFLPNQ